jgi:hypothetical protein
VALLEGELRKSKRAEQKLTALLYRLRQDVAALQADAAGGGGGGPQGSKLFDQLTDVRSLEYEVDFLTNKCKVRVLLIGCGLAALLSRRQRVLGCPAPRALAKIARCVLLPPPAAAVQQARWCWVPRRTWRDAHAGGHRGRARYLYVASVSEVTLLL